MTLYQDRVLSNLVFWTLLMSTGFLKLLKKKSTINSTAPCFTLLSTQTDIYPSALSQSAGRPMDCSKSPPLEQN